MSAAASSFAPLIAGGRQERGRRAGTENVPGIVGLGVAAELAAAHSTGRASRRCATASKPG